MWIWNLQRKISLKWISKIIPKTVSLKIFGISFQNWIANILFKVDFTLKSSFVFKVKQRTWCRVSTKSFSLHMHHLPSCQHSALYQYICCNWWAHIDISSRKVESFYVASLFVLCVLWLLTSVQGHCKITQSIFYACLSLLHLYPWKKF